MLKRSLTYTKEIHLITNTLRNHYLNALISNKFDTFSSFFISLIMTYLKRFLFYTNAKFYLPKGMSCNKYSKYRIKKFIGNQKSTGNECDQKTWSCLLNNPELGVVVSLFFVKLDLGRTIWPNLKINFVFIELSSFFFRGVLILRI